MGCLSSKPNAPPDEYPVSRAAPMIAPARPIWVPVYSSEASRQSGQMTSTRKPTHNGGIAPSTEVLRRMKSLPQLSPPSPPSPKIYRTRSVQVGSSRSQVLTPTVQQVLSNPSNPPKFRILVLGKKGSGKSSLINTVFKVDILAAPKTALGRANINHEIHPKDNRYLIVHECLGFEPGDVQGLKAIREFISYRTEPSRSAAEKLHAIWICVPTSDIISGSIGEGVEEILSIRKVPVVVACTKFDVVILIEGRNSRDHESARAKAYARYKQSYLSLFGQDLVDIPAKIVQVNSRLGDRVHNLVVTTDRLIMSPPSASIPLSEQRTQTRISPVRLAWSAALRAYHHINMEASIEVGRSRYWRNLRSSHNFVGQTLKNCINIIHVDIIEIWNLNDRTSYLSSTEFKEKVSHVVEDLAGPAGDVLMSGSRSNFSGWIDGVYQASQENVRCLMGYIVDLIAILGEIFRTTADYITTIDALAAIDRHIEQDWRDKIHRDIRRFVAETFATSGDTGTQRDLVLEKIMALIQQYCPPPFAEADAERDADLVGAQEETTLIISVG